MTALRKPVAAPDARAVTHALHGRWCGEFGLARCPSHEDKNPSLSIRDGDNGALVVFCFAGCSWKAVKDELRRLGLIEPDEGRRRPPVTRPPRPPGRIDDGARTAFAIDVWKASTSLKGTLGWQYFTERRGLNIGALDLGHCLRWNSRNAAIVALMTDPISNAPVGVHRTYLGPDGAKIERKMLGRQGVIRLTPDENVTLALGLVEGVEDGLAVLLSGWAPVWAATSAGAIGRFPVIGGVETLTIFADADDPGIDAAGQCLQRWRIAGREAAILPPRSEAA